MRNALFRGGKKKYYAVWGGPNPGVHYTVWDVARKWIERHSVMQRSFKDAGSAWQYYQGEKRSGLANVRPQTHAAPQAPRGPSIVQRSDQFPVRPQTHAAPQAPRGPSNVQRADQSPYPRPPQPPPSSTVPDPEADVIPLDHDILTTAREVAAALMRRLGMLEASPESSNPQSHRDSAPSPSMPSLAPPREPPLSPEQAKLVDLIVKERKNVFYTGSAGVGKSRVLKAFRQRLSSMGYKVNVVAPTGRAALDINGSTTWSYAGWTPDSMKKPLKDLQNEAWKNTTKKRLQKDRRSCD
ncbi:uncharacterized protein N0V89_004584 [Didymosphaeria variabile]|uniref:ATP-dependent DNA helicase n=1 Tax=Didymosphaeria variabile TaxID=1932322 RepID=A0A9W8XPQ4_9PLEO|nr:uncharacterized protein N0V89_004584 [Didymosphaeria variabile]KAJ4356550.1 hypothetical protein N0V89_004584 [Didymosphaeria variabile]